MAIWLKFKAWIIAVGAAIAAIIGVYFYGRRSGSLDEMQRQAKKDQDNARKIEDAADQARFDRIDSVNDAANELRKHSKLRD